MRQSRLRGAVIGALVALAASACGSNSTDSTGGAGYHSDTWTWDGATWSHRNVSTAPSQRAGAAFAYDENNGVSVLFGGSSPDSKFDMVDDTWTWDGSSWTRMHPPASPAARWRASMTFDQKRQVMVLFGGWGYQGSPGNETIGFLNDTWIWNGTEWKQLHPELSPPARLSQVAYDPTSNLVVLVNGLETWTWDGTTWNRRDDATTPPGAATAGLSQGPQGVILYGGGGCNMLDLDDSGTIVIGPLGTTWAWNGVTWTAVQPAAPPIALCNPSLVYDTKLLESILFGGRIGCGEYENNTYVWTGSTWTQKTYSVTPDPRAEASMAYDSAHDEVVLFGGFSLKPECGFANLP